jgi:hypothetical protein
MTEARDLLRDCGGFGELGRCLRCSRCGNRQIGVTVQPDTRTAEAIERDGPAPETRAGLPD